MEYNDTKHCALNGKTPNQVLRLFWVQNVRMENIHHSHSIITIESSCLCFLNYQLHPLAVWWRLKH